MRAAALLASVAGVTPSRPEQWTDAVQAVTVDQVTALAARLLQPGQLAAVVVGDAEVLERPLTDLGIPIKVVGRD